MNACEYQTIESIIKDKSLNLSAQRINTLQILNRILNEKKETDWGVNYYFVEQGGKVILIMGYADIQQTIKVENNGSLDMHDSVSLTALKYSNSEDDIRSAVTKANENLNKYHDPERFLN